MEEDFKEQPQTRELKWINCFERMPEKCIASSCCTNSVLFYSMSDGIKYGYYNYSSEVWVEERKDGSNKTTYNVVFWLEIPEIPKYKTDKK